MSTVFANVSITYTAGNETKSAGLSININGTFDDLVQEFWDAYNKHEDFYHAGIRSGTDPRRFISITKSAIIDVVIEEIR